MSFNEMFRVYGGVRLSNTTTCDCDKLRTSTNATKTAAQNCEVDPEFDDIRIDTDTIIRAPQPLPTDTTSTFSRQTIKACF